MNWVHAKHKKPALKERVLVAMPFTSGRLIVGSGCFRGEPNPKTGFIGGWYFVGVPYAMDAISHWQPMPPPPDPIEHPCPKCGSPTIADGDIRKCLNCGDAR